MLRSNRSIAGIIGLAIGLFPWLQLLFLIIIYRVYADMPSPEEYVPLVMILAALAGFIVSLAGLFTDAKKRYAIAGLIVSTAMIVLFVP